MSVKIDITGQVLTAHLEGVLDHHEAGPIREQIDNSIKQSKPSMVVLDFRDITFMDSSGIGLVMGRYKTTKEIGAQLHVCNTSPQIYKVMRLSGIERLAVLDKGVRK